MNFIVFFNEKKDTNLAVTQRVVSYLLARHAVVYMYDAARVSEPLFTDSVFYLSSMTAANDATFYAAVVIGGDGTILHAARTLYGYDVPMIGINLGTVGYLTELEVNECELLGHLFENPENTKSIHELPTAVTLDERMMLSFRVLRKGDTVFDGVALNEVTLGKGELSHMIDIELVHNDGVIAAYQCDGIIVSTPTGSTAYSLSAGGAIMDPKLSCIGVVPLCPYLSIYAGPIAFSDKANLELRFHSKRESRAYVSVDGNENFPLCDGDRLCIEAADHKAKLLRFKPTDFYRLLNRKMKTRMALLTDNKEEPTTGE